MAKSASPTDLQVLRERLTIEFLFEKTAIFSPHPREEGIFDTVTQKLIESRFKQYWKVWVEKDLARLFDAMEAIELIGVPQDQKARLDRMIEDLDRIINDSKRR